MPTNLATEEWWRQRRRDREALARKDSEEFFAKGERIPDLDFRPPDCPICLMETIAEDGQFICEICRVLWPSNGYGHEAERLED